MRRPRSMALIGAGAGLGIFALILLWMRLPPLVDYSWMSADSTPITERQVVDLLRRSARDEAHRRRRGAGAHVEVLIPESAKAKLYPVSYGQERLCSLGGRVVTPLLEVLGGSDTEPIVRERAAIVLATFDDPRILPSLAAAARNQRIAPSVLKRVLAVHLPIPGYIHNYSDDQVLVWLLRAEEVEYGELRLALLDQLLNLPFEEGGLWPYGPDIRVIRWLNRFVDHDMDEWLREYSPEAYAFRHAELEKGYDPIVAFSSFSGNVEYGGIGEGCRMVFREPVDQRACHMLIEATYGHSSMRAPSDDGALNRLREWYQSRRSGLVYDFNKHRFVFRMPASAASTGPGND